ncbi:MAG: ABC transporter permease [Bacteroidota bacterium]
MLKTNLKIALRFLARYKEYTAINIAGLAVGIACCMLIMLFVRSEWSYDNFHTKADRIHRVWLEEVEEGKTFTNTVTPIPLGPAMKNNLPEIETFCRVNNGSALVQYNNTKFNETITMVDSNFFSVFDFSLIKGSSKNFISSANNVVLTEPVAKKYFGNDDPIGKNISIQMGTENVLFTVSAIAKKNPLESSIQFDVLLPYANAHYLYNQRQITSAWHQVYGETYVVLKNNTTTAATEAKFDGMVKQLLGSNYKAGTYNIHLQNIQDIHLNNKLPQGNQPVSNPAYAYILSLIGILILLIACTNFVTLSIGRSATRALEVGVRKVLGAGRNQLIKQFWSEALLISIFSLIIGIALAILLLKPFNGMANRELIFHFDVFTICFCGGVLLFVALIAGLYPAFVLSASKPIKALKGNNDTAVGIGFFRKGLIVAQFTVSIIMIIATILIGDQLTYLRTKDLGYNQEHVVVIPTNKSRMEGMPLAKLYMEEIATQPKVINSSVSVFSFMETGWAVLGYYDTKNVYRDFRMNAIDDNFIKTMGLEIIKGRGFEKNNSSDTLNSMIVNEAMVKEYGWKDPIGQKLPGNYYQRVIGVVKDFNYESLHEKVKPLMLVLKYDSVLRKSSDVNFPASPKPRITVRLSGGDLHAQVAMLGAAWKKVAGNQDFEYHFLDENLAAQYTQEQRLGSIVTAASAISIFIACMGLFGLATLIVAKRTKEIGIRKVLGASVSSIVQLLSKDFLLMVLIASLISFPVAWWALQKWLQDFAYQVDIRWTVFGLAGLLALAVALLTVSFQSVKAARANPVKSLRTE